MRIALTILYVAAKGMKGTFALIAILLWAATSTASVAIDNTNTTISTCQANGTIEVIASGTGAPFIYSITAGPVTRPSQSSPIFNALPAGSYTVQVQNQLGETATLVDVIITGNYQLMDIDPIPVIQCTSSSNGYIIGNLESGGVAPYTWQLVPPSPVTTPPQSIDTFYNLPDGSYTLRVTDACGNFQTKGVVLSSVPSSLAPDQYTHYLLCGDSARLIINFTYTNLQFPMTVEVHDDMGNTTSIIINTMSGAINNNTFWNVITQYNTVQIYTILPHAVLGGSPWHAIITNACGVSLRMDGYTASAIVPFAVGVVAGSCPPKLGYAFQTINNQGMTTLLPDTLKYYLFDITLNMVTDSGMVTNAVLQNGIVGHSYRLILVDKCGKTYTSVDWVWADPAPPTVYPFPVGRECLDSTIAIEIQTQGFNNTAPLVWVIDSGPPTLQSTKPGFEYQSTLSYPDTFVVPAGQLFEIKNLPAGTYNFSVQDSCGQRIDSSFTILPSEVDSKSYTFNSTITGQCGIFNAINLAINRGHRYAYPFPLPHFTYTITNITTGQVIETDDVVDSVRKTIYNIPNGIYTIKIDFFEFPTQGFYLDNNDFCTIIYDTIVVNGSPFPHISEFVNSFCQASVTTQVLVDSSGGVPPYTYEVISGPQTFAPQLSNIFYLPVIGTYTFRVVDACGNSYVSATDIDTLRFPPITISNTPCPGEDILLIPMVSPFYTYHWQKPNGSTFNGDTLSVLNVSASDTGLYIITRYADINGCRDTVQSIYHLEMLARVNQSFTACQGDTIKVGTQRYTATGIYIDTLSAFTGCDSIVTTNLTITPTKYGSQSVIVCPNDVIRVGPFTFSAADTSIQVRIDTIPAASGCDSIVTTNITHKPAYSVMRTVSICQGDTAHIPAVYHLPGLVQYDTLHITTSQIVLKELHQQGNGCDSTIFVRVEVGPSYFDLRMDTICQGQSVAIGPYMHTQAGTYMDTLATITQCDSIILLILTVTPADSTVITQSICQGQSINGHNATGTYRDTLQTADGCDSIVVLHLTVSNYLTDTTNQTICAGDGYVFHGNVYTAAGTYSDTVSGPFCDSIVTLNLIVIFYLRDTVAGFICPGGSFNFQGNTYTAAGTYNDTIITPGCDSIHTLLLGVLPYLTTTTTQTICAGDGYNFHGTVYTAAGIYTDTVSGPACDSIVNLTLALLPYLRDTVAAMVCAGSSYIFQGNNYTAAGTYTDTVSGPGCDSILTLRLSIVPVVDTTINRTICAGESVMLGGIAYIQAGIYRDTLVAINGCDSIITLSLTVDSAPDVEILANATEVYPGDTVLLNTTATAVLSYNWTADAALLNNPNSQHPIAIITEPTWITMEAWGNNNCVAIDSIFISLLGQPSDCSDSYLYIPNVFSPDGNGVNDRFELFHNDIQFIELQVFNRWGELVFRTNNINHTWDGTFKGRYLSPDVYVYQLSYLNCDGVNVRYQKGSITLLK